MTCCRRSASTRKFGSSSGCQLASTDQPTHRAWTRVDRLQNTSEGQTSLHHSALVTSRENARTHPSQASENYAVKEERHLADHLHPSGMFPTSSIVRATTCPFCPRPGFQKRVWISLLSQNDRVSQIAKIRRIFRRIVRHNGSDSSDNSALLR